MANTQLPSRLFADREEPVGDRVNPYFKLNTLRVVLKALQPSDIERIRPVFGKILDLYSKHVFSGKLAHFLLTRQLDVVKRHEIWVVFAGKPIRFSLREFGLVTGLNYDPLPPLDPDLVKYPPGVTPYWFTLFGGKESVTVSMQCIKSRPLNQLAQATLAIQGFIHALVYVFVEVVLDALSTVGDGTNRESGEAELDPVISLKLDKVWDLDGEDDVDVLSIIPSKEDVTGVDDCSWVDEVSDPKVKVLLKHVEEGVKFRRGMLLDGFRGLAAQVTIRRS